MARPVVTSRNIFFLEKPIVAQSLKTVHYHVYLEPAEYTPIFRPLFPWSPFSESEMFKKNCTLFGSSHATVECIAKNLIQESFSQIFDILKSLTEVGQQ
jgi:hypothetical protein